MPVFDQFPVTVTSSEMLTPAAFAKEMSFTACPFVTRVCGDVPLKRRLSSLWVNMPRLTFPRHSITGLRLLSSSVVWAPVSVPALPSYWPAKISATTPSARAGTAIVPVFKTSPSKVIRFSPEILPLLVTLPSYRCWSEAWTKAPSATVTAA